MTMFLVVLHRSGPEWDAAQPLEGQSGWEAHAEYMDRLVRDGVVVLGGPLADEHRVIHAVQAESEDAVRATFARDPWRRLAPGGGVGRPVDDPARRARPVRRVRSSARRGADFLPPDPYADLPDPPRAAFEPPTQAAGRGSRVKLSLALGAGSIGAAALTYGALLVVSLPAAIAALVLGLGSRRAEPRRSTPTPR